MARRRTELPPELSPVGARCAGLMQHGAVVATEGEQETHIFVAYMADREVCAGAEESWSWTRRSPNEPELDTK